MVKKIKTRWNCLWWILKKWFLEEKIYRQSLTGDKLKLYSEKTQVSNEGIQTAPKRQKNNISNKIDYKKASCEKKRILATEEKGTKIKTIKSEYAQRKWKRKGKLCKEEATISKTTRGKNMEVNIKNEFTKKLRNVCSNHRPSNSRCNSQKIQTDLQQPYTKQFKMQFPKDAEMFAAIIDQANLWCNSQK